MARNDMQAKYVCLDTETTGLDPSKNALVEIGAIVLNDKLEPDENVATFHTLVRPVEGVHEIDAKAIKINKHEWVWSKSSDEYQSALEYPEACEELSEFLMGAFGKAQWIIMCGWNVSFDEGFLRELYNFRFNYPDTAPTAAAYPWPFHYHKLDFLGICRYLDIRAGRPPRKSYSLDALAKHFYGDGMAKFAMHTAMGDAQMTLKIIKAMEGYK